MKAGPDNFTTPTMYRDRIVPDEANFLNLARSVEQRGPHADAGDEASQLTAYADVFTRIEQASRHFSAVGLGAEYVRKFIR